MAAKVYQGKAPRVTVSKTITYLCGCSRTLTGCTDTAEITCPEHHQKIRRVVTEEVYDY